MTKTTRIAGIALLLGLAMLATELAVPTLTVPTLASAAATPAKAPLVDINSATQAELKALPGIGEGKARMIVDYRTKNGPFRSVDDLGKIEGFGKSTVDKVKGFAAVGD